MDKLIILTNAITYNSTNASGTNNTIGGNSNFFLILLIIIPVVIIVVMIMKKKKKNEGISRYEGRAVKDEVWRTLKRFLKDKNMVGQEIMDSYVVKVPNPYDKTKMTPQQKIDFETKQLRLKELKKTDKEKYKKEYKAYKQRMAKTPEEYMIWFVTKDTKTGVVADPRIILCRIEYKRTDSKARERIINIIGLQNYEKEMEWIKPIKDKDDRLFEKQQQAREKQLAKQQAREVKKQKNKNTGK